MSGIYVIGSGGHAKVAVATVLASGRDVAGMFDDDPARAGSSVLGIPVLGPPDGNFLRGKDALVAIGENRTRKEVVARFRAGVQWQTVVHPFAYVHSTVVLGAGTIVMAGAVVQPDAQVGEHGIINTGASVDHDCLIGNFSHVAPGAHLAGSVRLGAGVLVGTGSAVAPGCEIGSWTVVGAGATVTRNLSEGITAVGTPARPLSATDPRSA